MNDWKTHGVTENLQKSSKVEQEFLFPQVLYTGLFQQNLGISKSHAEQAICFLAQIHPWNYWCRLCHDLNGYSKIFQEDLTVEWKGSTRWYHSPPYQCTWQGVSNAWLSIAPKGAGLGWPRAPWSHTGDDHCQSQGPNPIWSWLVKPPAQVLEDCPPPTTGNPIPSGWLGTDPHLQRHTSRTCSEISQCEGGATANEETSQIYWGRFTPCFFGLVDMT